MRPIKRKQISKKVTGHIIIGLMAVFIVLASIIATSITKDLVKREQDKLTLLAIENASISREFMESMLYRQEVLVNMVLNLSGIEDDQKLKTMEGVIANTKKSEEDALSLFFVAEPDTFIDRTPNGYSISASAGGLSSEADMFKYINKEVYEQAKASKKMMIADPFEKTIDGKAYQVISVILPVLDAQNQFIGIVGSNIDTAVLSGADFNTGQYQSFGMQIVCGHQTVIINSKFPEFVGKKYSDVSDSTNPQIILDSAASAESLTFLDKNTDGKKYYKSYIPFYIQGSSVVWLSGTSIAQAEFNEAIISQVLFIAFWLVIALVILAALAYIRINHELRPIKKLETAVKELAKGNLQYQLDFTSYDELGSLADSLRESTATLYAYVADIDRAMGEMAKGNFNLIPSQPFIGDFSNIETSITHFLININQTLSLIDSAAQQVECSSEQVSMGAQALSQGSAEQASSIEELSATICIMTNRMEQVSANVEAADELIGKTAADMITENEQMQVMIGAMSDISRKSYEINKIIKTIDDIAFQTNILALNAAVEAARAGSAGKGFAVVADEVKNLAQKSAIAAKGTTELIESSIHAVDYGVEIAGSTAQTLGDMVDRISAITKKVNVISKDLKEETEGTQQLSMAVEQVADVVQTNSATAEESAAASEEMSGQAQMMKSMIAKFELKTDF